MKFNKKTLVIISSIFIGIIITIAVIINISMEENVQTFEGSEDLFSIYIKVDGEYIETDLMKFPSDLTFDSEESYCINGSVLNWNSTTKQMSLDVTGSEHCYVYFESNIANHIINLHNGVDGTNNIYYTNDSEYRYTGVTPNNYVTFNDETWRIIGVFSENTHGQTGEQLVKIIREDSIGNLSWDTKNSEQSISGNYGKNDWTTSNLQNILNDSYLNSTNGTSSGHCYNGGISTPGNCDFTTNGIKPEYRNYIKEVTWKLGGHSASEVTVSQMYGYERGTTVYNSSRPTEWSGKIGLMYPSDYGYASEASCYTTNLSSYSSGCDDSNWLYSGITEWTITPRSSYSRGMWGVHYDGYVINSYANNGYSSRPVLYLTSGVEYVSGTGTSSDPFIIGM